MIIYKAFIWSHLDYENVLYEKGFSNPFTEKLKPAQYNANAKGYIEIYIYIYIYTHIYIYIYMNEKPVWVCVTQ